jgi:hypothetical protein
MKKKRNLTIRLGSLGLSLPELVTPMLDRIRPLRFKALVGRGGLEPPTDGL